MIGCMVPSYKVRSQWTGRNMAICCPFITHKVIHKFNASVSTSFVMLPLIVVVDDVWPFYAV